MEIYWYKWWIISHLNPQISPLDCPYHQSFNEHWVSIQPELHMCRTVHDSRANSCSNAVRCRSCLAQVVPNVPSFPPLPPRLPLLPSAEARQPPPHHSGCDVAQTGPHPLPSLKTTPTVHSKHCPQSSSRARVPLCQQRSAVLARTTVEEVAMYYEVQHVQVCR